MSDNSPNQSTPPESNPTQTNPVEQSVESAQPVQTEQTVQSPPTVPLTPPAPSVPPVQSASPIQFPQTPQGVQPIPPVQGPYGAQPFQPMPNPAVQTNAHPDGETVTLLKWITGIMEGILAIPFLGGTIILSFAWTPLVFMFILHGVTLYFSNKTNRNKVPSIVGLVTSLLGVVPGLGWALHLVSCILLLISANKKD